MAGPMYLHPYEDASSLTTGGLKYLELFKFLHTDQSKDCVLAFLAAETPPFIQYVHSIVSPYTKCSHAFLGPSHTYYSVRYFQLQIESMRLRDAPWIFGSSICQYIKGGIAILDRPPYKCLRIRLGRSQKQVLDAWQL